jgi:hypothetical protein
MVRGTTRSRSTVGSFTPSQGDEAMSLSVTAAFIAAAKYW